MLKNRATQAASAAPPAISQTKPGPYEGGSTPHRGGRQPDTLLEAMTKSAVRAAGSQIGRQILRGVLGSMFGGTRR
jgi:hypothetical protein